MHNTGSIIYTRMHLALTYVCKKNKSVLKILPWELESSVFFVPWILSWDNLGLMISRACTGQICTIINFARELPELITNIKFNSKRQVISEMRQADALIRLTIFPRYIPFMYSYFLQRTGDESAVYDWNMKRKHRGHIHDHSPRLTLDIRHSITYTDYTELNETI
jgi:hypothetical protein